MKTKVFVFVSAIMLSLGASTLSAQSADKKSDDVVLNVRLHKIQSLVVNTSQKTVNIDYKTIDDYANGVSSLQEDHLEVFSTGGFTISAQTSGENLIGTGDNSKTISVSDIKVKATTGTDNTLTADFTDLSLSNGEQNLIRSTLGGRSLKYNVEYGAAGSDAYINHYNKDEDPTVYTTTVTYTITAS